MRTLLHMLGCLTGLERPATQVTGPELDMLRKHAGGAKVVVEIGTFEGSTTVALAKATTGMVYTVDPFMTGRLGISYGEWITRMTVGRSRCGNVRILRGYSHEVAPTFREPIDFLFIDADHSYEGIRRDWNGWTPKVVSGGIIALHDSRLAPNSSVYLGSMRFYAEDVRRMADVEEIGSVDSLVVLRKR